MLQQASALHQPHRPERSATIHRRVLISSVVPLAPLFLLDSPSAINHNSQRPSASVANAALPFTEQEKDRRQLDLCLVNLLRLQYWAITVSTKLQPSSDNVAANEETIKNAYLEARLGSKVMVAKTKKIGGGANANVFMLKGLQIKDCLDDLKYYAERSSKKQMSQYAEDLVEALASIVEFDGLETTQDPSPRSSLTLGMFNSEKQRYVQRMLAERVVPLTDDILRVFGPDTKARCTSILQEVYPREVPDSLRQQAPLAPVAFSEVL
jgi:hypothetical protein